MANNTAETTVSAEGTNIKVRVPKRVLHFSDGILEEFSDEDGQDSTDSVDGTRTKPNEHSALIDPRDLHWGPWFAYKFVQAGTVALAVCDYVGESLANFLGITTPKYQYELDEFERSEKERQEREAQAEGWSLPAKSGPDADINLMPITQEQTSASAAGPPHPPLAPPSASLSPAAAI